MDLYDRRILAVLRDGKPRNFQQILSKVEFSYNTLRLHLAQLVEQGLVMRRKRLQQSPGRPQFAYALAQGVDGRAVSALVDPYKGLVVLSFERLRRICRHEKGGYCKEIRARARRERTDALLDLMGLGEAASRRVGKYSGGMVRRTSLAMALVHEPDIAFLDEPTVGMDPQSRRATWDLIKGLKERGKTVILTTHYIEEAEALADRVGIIDHGKLIALDTPGALMEEHGAENLEEVFIKLTGRRIREEV